MARMAVSDARRSPRRRRPFGSGLVVAALATVTVLATACGNGSASSSGAGPGAASPAGSAAAAARGGTASVAFAGSLLKLDDSVIGPAFEKATGAGYQGQGAGSVALAQEITSGEITPGVFESVGSAPISRLEPRFTRWYVEDAASPLVIAYNPHAPAAAVFRAARATDPASLRKVFEAMAAPGFLLGRTDPATDPQGQAFVMMVELAQKVLGLPSGIVDQILGPGAATGAGRASQVFSETALDATLQAGQLDAASAFLSQAVQLHLPYVALPDTVNMGEPADAARYATATVTIPGTTPGTTTTVHGAPLVVDLTTIAEPAASPADRAAAAAFVAYVLSPAGRRATAGGGYTLLPERLVGRRSAVPAAVARAVLRAGAGSAGSPAGG